MKAFIQHESRGRLRVRMHQYRMSLEQADLLEAYLLSQPGVKSAGRSRAHPAARLSATAVPARICSAPSHASTISPRL